MLQAALDIEIENHRRTRTVLAQLLKARWDSAIAMSAAEMYLDGFEGDWRSPAQSDDVARLQRDALASDKMAIG